jgi:hypothetical protein
LRSFASLRETTHYERDSLRKDAKDRKDAKKPALHCVAGKCFTYQFMHRSIESTTCFDSRMP